MAAALESPSLGWREGHVAVLSITQFTGRRLESAEDEWAFEKGAYL